jgi:hypothetical protein
MWHEYIGNLHSHTLFSDGFARHNQLARAAIRAGLDFVITTDHNVYVPGLDGYRYLGTDRVLLLVGEEVHDQKREPQANHMLIYEARQELSPSSACPQELLDAANSAGGLAFLAHPFEKAAPLIGEPALDWANWDISGFTGIEIWNFMSEFKGLLHGVPAALYYAYHPHLVAHGPDPRALARWDELLASGKRVVAIGGADAHGLPVSLGPIKKIVFPYEVCFKAINTHVLSNRPLNGDVEEDRRNLFESLRSGNCFVGYDLPAPTRGFRFSAHGEEGDVPMGGSVALHNTVILQAHSPQLCDMQLVRHGEIIGRWEECEGMLHHVREPGAYRVEAFIPFHGKMRGWIFSNPIYITDS